MRASAARERCARAGVDAEPEPEVLAAVHPVEAELVGIVELPRVVVRGAVEHHHRGAGREVDTADRRVDTRANRNCACSGVSSRSVSSTKFGMSSRSSRSCCCSSGPLAEEPEHRGEQPGRRFPARREQVGGDQHDVVDVGQRAVGERRGGQLAS